MVDLNKLKEKYASLAQQGGGNKQDFLEKFFMLDEGEAGVRILPWDRDDQDFYAETAIHRINGKNYHCPRVKDKECPVCDGYHAIWKQINATGGRDAGNNPQLAELARGIKANKRFYMNVIDRRTDDVKILSMGQKLFTKILSYLLNEDYISDSGQTVIDLAQGNDFKVVKKKIGGFPNYDESAFRPKKTPAMESEGRTLAAMEQLHDIHSLVRVAEYSELKTLTDEAMAMVDMISGNTSSSPAETSPEQGEDDYLSHLPKLDL